MDAVPPPIAAAEHLKGSPGPLITSVTVYSFGLVLALLVGAYYLSLATLPTRTSSKLRVVFIWHLFDSLVHLIMEGSYLYHSFFSSAATQMTGHSSTVLWGDLSRSYGAIHSEAPLAKLWQEYALADFRWGTADITIVSLELLTVLIGGPLAAWIAEMVRRGYGSSPSPAPTSRGHKKSASTASVAGGRDGSGLWGADRDKYAMSSVGGEGNEGTLWFWITVLATAELYGGWVTFAPEWLSGSLNLESGNVMYKWVYLAFFNGIWVVIPGWLLWEAFAVFKGLVRAREKRE